MEENFIAVVKTTPSANYSNVMTLKVEKATTKANSKDQTTAKSDIKKRENWSSHIDYILSSIGYCVGFGAFWRFPYVCMRNGGGAFLIPYFLSLLICGMPLFLLETVVGQFTGLGPTGVWNLCPIFKGVGWSMMLMSGLVSVYSAMVLAWVLHFTASSFTYSLPWASCENSWNTPACFERGHGDNQTTTNTTIQQAFSHADTSYSPYTLHPLNTFHPLNTPYATNTSLATNVSHRTSAEEYWELSVLQLSPGIEELNGVRWPLFACLLATWVMLFLCLFKGIKWSGKVVYVTATLPYIFLTVLLVRGAMLPGALQGILFYLRPDFQQLKRPKVWAEACLQIFYSLGPTWGGLIAMARYNKFHNNYLRDTVVICLTSTLTSFYSGFICFSVLGYMAQKVGKKVKDVVSAGPGLVFNLYPEALAQMPLAPLWSVCFFLTMLLIGIDSLIGLIETVTSGITDEYPDFWKKRKGRLVGVICFFLFLLGIPLTTQGGMYVFQILDWYMAVFATSIIALLECFALVHIYGSSKLYEGMQEMLGRPVSPWWKFCWLWITPTIMLSIFLYICTTFTLPSYGAYHYPPYVIAIGKFLACVSIIPIPVCVCVILFQKEGSLIERLKKGISPRQSTTYLCVRLSADDNLKRQSLLKADDGNAGDALPVFKNF